MGMRLRHLAGAIIGDYEVNASTAAYVAGQPLKIGVSGLELCTEYIEGNDNAFVGFARGHSGGTTDRKSDVYNARAAYVSGAGNVVEGNDDDPDNPSDTFPFDTTLTYTVGQDVFVNQSGLLSNRTPGASGSDVPSNSEPVGFVLEAPAASGDNLVIQTY